MEDIRKMLVHLPYGIEHSYEMNPWVNAVGHLPEGGVRQQCQGATLLNLVLLVLKDQALVYNFNDLSHHLLILPFLISFKVAKIILRNILPIVFRCF